MADPTIQTFCCQREANSTFSSYLTRELNTDSYNAVCLFSSTIGIIGATLQILPRKSPTNSRARNSPFLSKNSKKTIVWLAIADLLAALGVFVRSILWLNRNIYAAKTGSKTDETDLTTIWYCVTFAAWIQYFYTATWIWTLCYAIDVRLFLFARRTRQIYYHVCSWLLPAVLTGIGLGFLYLPDASCHASSSTEMTLLHILPNYLATFAPMVVVMVTNPCIYASLIKNMEDIVIGQNCQLTLNERKVMENIRNKFLAINVAFYICWLPNVLSAVFVWSTWFTMDVRITVGMWYLMAVTNPLQALFNCFVYRSWRKDEKICLPCLPTKKKLFPAAKTSKKEEENVPLLEGGPKKPINDYKTYAD